MLGLLRITSGARSCNASTVQDRRCTGARCSFSIIADYFATARHDTMAARTACVALLQCGSLHRQPVDEVEGLTQSGGVGGDVEGALTALVSIVERHSLDPVGLREAICLMYLTETVTLSCDADRDQISTGDERPFRPDTRLLLRLITMPGHDINTLLASNDTAEIFTHGEGWLAHDCCRQWNRVWRGTGIPDTVLVSLSYTETELAGGERLQTGLQRVDFDALASGTPSVAGPSHELVAMAMAMPRHGHGGRRMHWTLAHSVAPTSWALVDDNFPAHLYTVTAAVTPYPPSRHTLRRMDGPDQRFATVCVFRRLTRTPTPLPRPINDGDSTTMARHPEPHAPLPPAVFREIVQGLPAPTALTTARQEAAARFHQARAQPPPGRASAVATTATTTVAAETPAWPTRVLVAGTFVPAGQTTQPMDRYNDMLAGHVAAGQRALTPCVAPPAAVVAAPAQLASLEAALVLAKRP